MPHSSRRNRKAPSTKRREELLDDGWTRVTRTGRNEHGRITTESFDVEPVQSGLNVEKLSQELDKMRARWLESDCRTKLADVLRPFLSDHANAITEGVCVALGSVSRGWSHRFNSIWQLILFLDIVEQIESVSQQKIRLYAQEPRFSDLDKEFLTSRNITVLEDPEARDHVGNNTFLFIPYLEWSTEIPYTKAAKDAPLYVTSGMNWVIEEAERAEREVARSEFNDEVDRETKAESSDAIQCAHMVLDTHRAWRIPNAEPAGYNVALTIYMKNDEQEAQDQSG